MKVLIVNRSKNPLPKYETTGSAGMDLRADIPSPWVIEPMQRQAIPTGLYIQLPPGYEGQIRPRSGLSVRDGITLVNCVGTLDSDYRGEVCVPLINLSPTPYTVKPGDRIAQLVVAQYEKVAWDMVGELDETDRGMGGFGSTGQQ